jgi:hypothetical protein
MAPEISKNVTAYIKEFSHLALVFLENIGSIIETSACFRIKSLSARICYHN